MFDSKFALMVKQKRTVPECLMITIQKIRGTHALLAGKLNLQELQKFPILTSDIERFALDENPT